MPPFSQISGLLAAGASRCLVAIGLRGRNCSGIGRHSGGSLEACSTMPFGYRGLCTVNGTGLHAGRGNLERNRGFSYFQLLHEVAFSEGPECCMTGIEINTPLRFLITIRSHCSRTISARSTFSDFPSR